MVLVELPRNPGTLAARCGVAGAGALVTPDGESKGWVQDLGAARRIEVDQTSGSKKVKVEFTLPDNRYNKQEVVVEAGELKVVTCGKFE